jgi:hypothetical protein
LFALLDSVSQSILAPLHDILFEYLRSIPNDGTFDQDASIKRSQSKAMASGCAYSFDLTAATDRLPAALTANIISTIVKVDIAKEWLEVMTNRKFFFNAQVALKLKISAGPYQYAVGQPMGGLSSWAGLAITHHWIVQLASFNAYSNQSWFENYEILGDDLVIFDRKVADEYLIIMQDLGCEINLHKSIVSHSRPVFEFAKRTCWGDQIVSGISLNQIMAGNSIGARITNVLGFSNAGLITSPSLLAVTLSKYLFRKGKSAAKTVFETRLSNDKFISLSVLALLGSLVNSKLVSLESLMAVITNPKLGPGDYTGNRTSVPVQASIQLILKVLKERQSSVGSKPTSTIDVSAYLSQYDKRAAIYALSHSDFIQVILAGILEKANTTMGLYEDFIRSMSEGYIYNFYYKETSEEMKRVSKADYPDYIQDMYAHLYRLALGIQNLNPQDELDEIIEQIYGLGFEEVFDIKDFFNQPDFVSHGQNIINSENRFIGVSFEQVLDLQDKLDRVTFKINPPVSPKPGKFIMESAPIVKMLKSKLIYGNRNASHRRDLIKNIFSSGSKGL